MYRLILLLPLAACAAPSPTTQLALANPASVFCTQSGGQLVMRQTSAGTKGYCLLKDGRSLDEWEYFRQMHP
jgi:putative hemolysin